MKTHDRCAASLLIVALIGLVGLATPAMSQHETVSKSFSANPGGSLVVDLGSGDIHVATWEKNEVAIHAMVDDEEDISMTQNGTTVSVNASSASTITVTIPSRFNAELESGSGEIRVDGPLEGNVKSRTMGGEITLGTLSGTIRATTSGGDISGSDIRGEVTIKSAGGDLTLGNVDGDATMKTDGGEITVKDVTKSLVASTSGGNVQVGKVGKDARISTAGGDVEVGMVEGTNDVSSGGGNIVVHGSGTGISASTGGGDIVLEQVQGTCTAATGAGNVTASLAGASKGGSRKGNLTTGAGDIVVDVPSGVGITVTAHIRMRGWWHSSGDKPGIKSEFPSESYQTSEGTGDISATYRVNGGGDSFTIKTTMGNITLRKGTH